jgi:hypothetical protein
VGGCRVIFHNPGYQERLLVDEQRFAQGGLHPEILPGSPLGQYYGGGLLQSGCRVALPVSK